MFTFSQLWKQNKAEQECFLVLTSDMLFNIAFGDDNWLWRGIPGAFSPWRCLLDLIWELQAFADVRATIDEATLMIWLKLYMPHQEVFARHRWNEREILLHSFFFSGNGLGHFKWPLTFSREPVLPYVKLVADWWNTADSTRLIVSSSVSTLATSGAIWASCWGIARAAPRHRAARELSISSVCSSTKITGVG